MTTASHCWSKALPSEQISACVTPDLVVASSRSANRASFEEVVQQPGVAGALARSSYEAFSLAMQPTASQFRRSRRVLVSK